MKTKPLYFVLISLLVVILLGFIGIAYAGDKLLGGQAAKLSKLRADSSVLDEQQTALTKNKRDLAKYSNLNLIAETVVPKDKNQAQAVQEIVDLAANSGIKKLSSITLPASSLGAIGSAGSKPNLTQLTPVKDIPGVYQLQITISQTTTDEVPYNQFISFLSKLEQNRRTAQVSSITVQPDSKNPNQVSFTLVINEYIKP